MIGSKTMRDYESELAKVEFGGVFLKVLIFEFPTRMLSLELGYLGSR
jgi:hypothetical protein